MEECGWEESLSNGPYVEIQFKIEPPMADSPPSRRQPPPPPPSRPTHKQSNATAYSPSSASSQVPMMPLSPAASASASASATPGPSTLSHHPLPQPQPHSNIHRLQQQLALQMQLQTQGLQHPNTLSQTNLKHPPPPPPKPILKTLPAYQIPLNSPRTLPRYPPGAPLPPSTPPGPSLYSNHNMNPTSPVIGYFHSESEIESDEELPLPVGSRRTPAARIPLRSSPSTSIPLSPSTPTSPSFQQGQGPFQLSQRQLQMSHAIASPAMFISDPRTAQVRRNWLHHVFVNFTAISRSSKLLLVAVSFIMVSEIIAGTFVLLIAHSTGEVCDTNLDAYVLVHVIRVILSLPLVIFQYLHPPSLDNSSTPTLRSSRGTTASNRNNLPTTAGVSTTATTTPTPASSPISPSGAPPTPPPRRNHRRPSQTQPPHVTKDLTLLVDRIKSCLDAFGILWFILGNWWIFTSTGCNRTAPLLYYLSLVFLGMGYIVVSIPILMCGGIVFCLPCMLVWSRTFRGDDDDGMGKVVASLGASDEVIRGLPVLTFRKRNTVGMEKKRSSGYSDPLLLAFPVMGGVAGNHVVGGGGPQAIENRKAAGGRNVLVMDSNATDAVDTSAGESTPLTRSNSYHEMMAIIFQPTMDVNSTSSIASSPVMPPRPKPTPVPPVETQSDLPPRPLPKPKPVPSLPQHAIYPHASSSDSPHSPLLSTSPPHSSPTTSPAAVSISPKLPPRPQSSTGTPTPLRPTPGPIVPSSSQTPASPPPPPPPVQRRPQKVIKTSNALETQEGVVAMDLDDDDSICVICLTSYEEGDGIKPLGCGHHFHVECVDEWLRLNKTCPLCKSEIVVTIELSEM
ncbi:hypothetical protein BCR33DRAFT_854714 [Rhizoclosmatium globosum]|uniref:RING-type domain-containing protein n=1 Tax=Rhizoclosmatium globosum TaxID=329046 RepID=A0A1Y2BRR8_9FUNG|nr:hypothetical protein BCR33DRAFT_854714 [Rhizoclosmatium globosum]|eukprot:ORY37423.1 hypothetical protein BCR33DRAFT_854714 [Rhizoclosmatium globosum]